MTADCVFCSIIAGREPAGIVARDAATVAFMHLTQRPGNEGHVLVVPRAHVPDIYPLDAATAGAVFMLCSTTSPHGSPQRWIEVAGFATET